jgi:LAO/AO transport system kinase
MAAAAGSVRDIARLLSQAENGGRAGAEVAATITGRPRGAHIVGVTGAPGAGKSTLVGALLAVWRGAGARVAVLAVDPSSPLTGGALLGDRVRMSTWATDGQVYIRSLSSRGNLGGISAGTPAAVDLLSALGFDVVVVETVGVGQSEVDVMNLADTVAVVLAPGMGDSVQAAKAGIMEIADILVVNKADHEGARTAVRELKAMLALGGRPAAADSASTWRIPVLSTVAETGQGAAELADALRGHRAFLTESGQQTSRRTRRARAAVEAIVLERVRGALVGPAGRAAVSAAADNVISGDTDAYRAADAIVGSLAALQAPR